MTPVLLLAEPTPIADMLEGIIGGESLATWNPSRGRGGEWDTLRETPLRTRQRLTGAGYLSARGMLPDEFTDLLGKPIDWYIRTALLAMDERHAARRRAREKALAKSTGNDRLFRHRDQLARAAGFRSYYDYRMNSGWGDGHGRGLD